MLYGIVNLVINTRPFPYLDPGTGSMIIQMVIAAVLGAGVLIRVFWRNIKAFFTGKKSSDASVEDPTGIVDDDPTALPSDSTSTKE